LSDPDPFDSLERGIDRAKYVHIVAPLSAAGIGVYALTTGTEAGLVIAVALFAYTMVWLFANGSTAVLIIVSNWSDIKRVRARGTAGTRQETLPDQGSPKRKPRDRR
jgi:hypothetical protein